MAAIRHAINIISVVIALRQAADVAVLQFALKYSLLVIV